MSMYELKAAVVAMDHVDFGFERLLLQLNRFVDSVITMLVDLSLHWSQARIGIQCTSVTQDKGAGKSRNLARLPARLCADEQVST